MVILLTGVEGVSEGSLGSMSFMEGDDDTDNADTGDWAVQAGSQILRVASQEEAGI